MADLIDVPFTTDLHLRLLLSLDRGHNVRRAVQEAVRGGERVLDAGTGSGLLAFVALQAGAREAVGVDRQHLEMARVLSEKNGLADRVRFVQADLLDLAWPGADAEDEFDLLLAFIYTNHPLVDEARSRAVFELRDRYCADGATVVPGAVRYYATGCDRRDWDLHTELSDLQQAAGILRGYYDLDFQPLVDAAKQELAIKRSRPTDPTSQDWRPPTTMASVRFSRDNVRLLTDQVEFTTIDYHGPRVEGFPPEVELRAVSAGRLSGVVWTQELRSQGRALWTTETYSPLAQPLSVSAGDRVVCLTDDTWRATNVLHTK